MLCDVTEAAWYLGYASPASLYRLLKAGLLDNYVEMHQGQVLLRMGSKGKSPTLAKRVRSLVNFKGGHEMLTGLLTITHDINASMQLFL